MDAHILIVENGPDISTIAATHLRKLGYSCTQAFSGCEAQMLLPRANPNAPHPFDLILCDLMIPGLTGEELIANLRNHGDTTPVIVVSARTACTDRVALLRKGADDYICKPFDLDELAARVDVQLRRRTVEAAISHSEQDKGPRGAAGKGVLTFNSWRLDPSGHTFTVDALPFDLTPIEFKLIATLMAHPHRAFSKQELFEAAWGEPYAADDDTVTVHISNIRAKLRPTGTDGYIKTVWGMGFKLQEPA